MTKITAERYHDMSPPLGGMDRNDEDEPGPAALEDRPPRGGVDRNIRLFAAMNVCQVAPRAGAWIETPPSPWPRLSMELGPGAGAWIETRN